MVPAAATAQAGAMTTTPPEAPSGPPPQEAPGETGPRVDRDQVRDLGRLRRTRLDRKVAGVAGGLGRHLDVDPLILRVAFVVLVFFGGAGLIVYGACWLLVPEDGAERARIHLDDRTRSVALLIVGVIAGLALIGDSWGAFWFPWPLALVALVTLWLLTRNNPSRPPAPPAAYPPPAYPPAPAFGQAQPPTAPAQSNPYAATSYQAPPPPPVHTVPAPVYAAPQRIPNPRKRGPILFWFTLALIALSEGVLGMIDLAGAAVADPAYPALAVGVCGLMLVVGAFFGRAGGIILVGLLSAAALTAATAADRWDGDTVRETPTSASGVQDRYWLGAGEQVIDLRQVGDLDRLDGRTIEVESGVGHLEVIVPDDLTVTVHADVDGFGAVELFGVEHGGADVHETSHDGSARDPEITIDAQLGVGQIEVHR